MSISFEIISNTYISRGSFTSFCGFRIDKPNFRDCTRDIIIRNISILTYEFASSSTFRTFVCRKSKIPSQILRKISAAILSPYRRRHNLFRPTNANVLGTANPLVLSSELDAGKVSKENFSQCKRGFHRI